MTETVKDPVCHMQVPSVSFAIENAGINYAFCSVQCRERFLANPHLYTGFPGMKSPAQAGKQVIKCRRLSLSAPLDAIQSKQVKNTLLEMMGVLDICIDGDKIEIQYDLMQTDVEQITVQLALIGTDLGRGWVDRLKLAFINYQEECEISSLEVNDTKGCH